MKNLTPELIAKAKSVKSAEELLELAKANNVELSEEEAKIYFLQMNANEAVSDDELDAVVGGGCPEIRDIFAGPTEEPLLGKRVKLKNGEFCHKCRGNVGIVAMLPSSPTFSGGLVVYCETCGTQIAQNVTTQTVEII